MASKKEYTELQQKFLKALPTTGGNIRLAMRAAGYSEETHPNAVTTPLADEILEVAKNLLAGNAVFAAASLIEMIDQPSQVGANVKLNAIKDLLDRIGMIKEQKVEVSGEMQGVIILPAKDPIPTVDDE